MRSVIENSLDRGQLPVKVWYSGAFFRAERPQAGRYRQFYQVGVEAIGLDDPAIDAEVIAIADRGFKKIGLKNYRLEITSLGDTKSRAAHRVDLLKFISTLRLDEATAARAAINPLRLFDDKRDEMKQAMEKAPLLMDYLSPESESHFKQVLAYLAALKVDYVLNPRMVRGLDYYTGTTFEFVHSDLGAQSGIGGGGRYDGLMETLGGQNLSGIGFGLGVDRALLGEHPCPLILRNDERLGRADPEGGDVGALVELVVGRKQRGVRRIHRADGGAIALVEGGGEGVVGNLLCFDTFGFGDVVEALLF
jgi:histidyl-tRNA synthetase